MSFVKVESGDGTLIRAKRNFQTETDGSVLTITFDSGEVYTLDYAEDLIEVSTSGSVITIDVLDMMFGGAGVVVTDNNTSNVFLVECR